MAMTGGDGVAVMVGICECHGRGNALEEVLW